MVTLTIYTPESDTPAKFDIDADHVHDYIRLLSEPDAVLELAARSGGTAYIPVRNITYVHVSDDHNPANPNY